MFSMFSVRVWLKSCWTQKTCCKGSDFTLCDPWGHTFLMALIISGVTFDGHFLLAFTSSSVLHPYVCVVRTYIPGHMHLGVTQEVSLTL